MAWLKVIAVAWSRIPMCRGAGTGLSQGIKGPDVLHGPFHPVPGNTGMNDSGVDPGDGFIVYPQLRFGGFSQVRHEHIRGFHQALKNLPAGFRLNLQTDISFIPVGNFVGQAHAIGAGHVDTGHGCPETYGIAGTGLNLDNFGTQITQDGTAAGARVK